MYLKRDRILTALAIMFDVAFYAGRSGVVSGTDIAKRNGLMRRGIEPILQALSRAQLLDSVRGPKGGYRLARSPRVISLKEIAQVVGTKEHGKGNEIQNQLFERVLAPYWNQLNVVIEDRMQKETLSDFLQLAEKEGLSRPSQAPLTFSI
ncbi:transcriptional regulator [Aristophania vespae]|uniref:Transcriptional regulator n=1 Tax=Aristophania vespae TaxID=2697033 RepID=A0A6P1NJC0_9PROT|nr:Rrf2 family transcriptional regulator [Aristophania vespae]QHI94961.1 transcriptional regulator [Aristophania vespae]UMM64123.1 HTH-type transcriptional regulator IscR [Aristophania vespae]